MRLAFLSDIHGNIGALEAVLADCDAAGVDAFVFLGDLVFFGLYPQPCFDALSARAPLICIKGNTDANLEEVETFTPRSEFERQLLEVVRDCAGRLTSDTLGTISSWPVAETLTLEGHRIMCCHGSPYHFNDRLSDPIADEHLARRVSEEPEELVCCAHTHVPQVFGMYGKPIVNIGAVGYSFDGDPRASYAIIDVGEHGLLPEIRRIEYDRERYAGELDLKARRMPLWRSIAYAVRNGMPLQDWKC